MVKKFVYCLIFVFILVSANVSCHADTVVYNVKTGKIHSPNCQWAYKCTANCIKIERKEAVNRGGIPCKVCGGR